MGERSELRANAVTRDHGDRPAPGSESPNAFVLEQYGRLSSDEGLAICSPLEIKALLRRLANDYLACLVLFELGCNFYNPATGARRPHVLKTIDFLHHTDVGDTLRLYRCLATINGALRALRGDPDAVLCRIGRDDAFYVNETTQHRIYEIWRRLTKVPPQRLPPANFAPAGAILEPAVG